MNLGVRLATIACSLLLAASVAPSQARAGDTPVVSGNIPSSDDPGQDWWDRLTALCGQAFEGMLDYAPAGDDAFAGQRLVMHVRECTPQRIRIPFVVGDNRSRTWVLTRRGDRIELKHDHRHADGTPEPVTQYGGTTSNAGSADAQMFPADEATRHAISGSGQRSVWLIEVGPGAAAPADPADPASAPERQFVYAANRVGTRRGFRLVFDLAKPVSAPPAPWGWPSEAASIP